MSLKGIDVSKHQGVIDWERVKKAGVQFVMLRAGYGQSTIDPQFKRNVTECNRLQIPCGIYWFSYAYTEAMARKEAESCLAAIKPYRIEYPVCFDLEYDTVKYAKKNGVTIDKALASKLVQAFCGTIEKAGYYAMNYANKDYLKNMFTAGVTSKYDLWYAYYQTKCDRKDAGIWQHSSTGTVAGIAGYVDLDVSNKDYPTIIKQAGLNGLTKPKTSTYDQDVKTVQEKAGLADSTINYLKEYKNAEALFNKLAKAMK